MGVTNKHSMDLFLAACGAAGPIQLSIDRYGRPEGGHRVLPRPFALIGRDPGTDLPLDETLISRRHAYLQLIEGRLFCVDLGSRTGIHWERETRKSGWLGQGQFIRIGTYSIHFAEGGRREGSVADDRDPLTVRSLNGETLPDVMLEFTNTNPRRIWEMNCVMALVGRAPDCRVRLKGSNVSEHHCSLVRTARGLWVVDLLGQDGVRVNQRRVPWAYLSNGDQLQVGSFVIRVWHNAPPLVPDRPVAVEANHHGAALDSLGFPGEERILFDAEDNSFGKAATALAPVPDPSDLALVQALDQEEIREALLQPLVHQFAEMQQQMSDQFQQAMTMVLEMFGGMHQSQANIIREEIDRLQQLTEEMQSLQEEVAKTQTAPAAKPSPAPNHAAGTPASEKKKPPVLATPAPSAGVPEPTRKIKDSHPALKTADETFKGGAPFLAADRDAPVGEGTAEEVHSWLFHRIEQIQTERKSRLEKIFGFLRGK